MQSAEDFVVWLRCLYLWSSINFEACRDRYAMWRRARREAAAYRRELDHLELWAAIGAGPAASRLRRIHWDIDQASGETYLRQFTARHD